MEIERRVCPAEGLELRDESGVPPLLVGYAAVFNAVSLDLGGFKERIAPGAFAPALRSSGDIVALWNHDANYPIGRVRAKTLSVSEDVRGLRIEATPPDTQWARDLLVSIRRGDVDQMSFGFFVGKDSWDKVGEEIVRTIVEVQRLVDVSPVTLPAYPETSVAVRSLDAWMSHQAIPSGLPLAWLRRRLLLD